MTNHAAAIYEAAFSGCGMKFNESHALGFRETIDCLECRAIVARERAALDLPPINYKN